jgi:hypothetical protein
MRQLKCADLKPGDVMLKAQCGSATAKIISISQRFAGQLNPQVVHAGVMFDRTYIIEAERQGVVGRDLRIQDRSYGYIVYRPAQEPLAAGAATCAKMIFDIHQQHGTVKYNFPGLSSAVAPVGPGKVRSASAMDELLGDILKGRGHPFYCSQFVVYIYQFVGRQNAISAGDLFDVSDARVSPSTLASLLQSNPWFNEAGFMLPNER